MSETLKDIGIGVGSAAAGAGASYIAYEAWRRSAERTVLDGKPASSTRVDAAGLAVDAETFQFKSGGDRTGVTDRLQGVKKWNAAAAGKVMVYEYADGRRVVADGHQRLGLAKRLMSEGHSPIKMDAIVLRQSDGWSPRDVRAFAAIKNMHESSGNALDMARVMRERPDLVTSSLPVSDAKIREAKALSKLSNDAFRSVASGAVEPGVAAAVAEGVPDSSRHVAMIKEMAEAKIKGHEHARLYVKQAMAAPSISETTTSLFGDETQVRSLTKERSTVLHRALTSLKSNKKLFAMLEREADTIEAAGNKLNRATNASKADVSARLGTLVEKLATQRGNVSRLLDEAAQAVASGEKAPKAARSFLKSVQSAMEKGGIQALVGDGPLPLEANGGMQRMTDSGGRLKASVGRFGVYHVGKNAYEVRDKTTGTVLDKADQYGTASSKAQYWKTLESSGDEHGILRDRLAASSPKKGQTSFLPDATTKEQIAAAAKAKGKPGVPQQDVGGLFGDGMKQMDLVDRAREMNPNRWGGENRPLPASPQEIAVVERAIKHGKAIELSTTHKDIISRASNAQVSALDDLAHQYRRTGAMTDADFNRVSAFREAFRAQAKITSDAAHNAAFPGWSDEARAASAEVRAAKAKFRPTPGNPNSGMYEMTPEHYRSLIEEARALPKSDPTRSMKIEHAMMQGQRYYDANGKPIGARGSAGLRLQQAADQKSGYVEQHISTRLSTMKAKELKAVASDLAQRKVTNLDEARHLIKTSGLNDRQIDAAIKASTPRKTSGSRAAKKAGAISAKDLQAAARQLSDATSKFANVAQNIKSSAGDRRLASQKVMDAHARLNALRPADAKDPRYGKIGELANLIDRDNFAANSAKAQRLIADIAGEKPSGEAARPLATSRAKGKKTEYAVRIGDKIVDTRTSDRAYTHAIVARHSFESDMKTGGSIHKVDQRNFDYYTEVAKRQPDKFTPAEYIEQAKATVAKYGNRDAYAKAKMEGRVAEITAKKAAGYYDKPVVVAWAGRPDLANKQVASYGKAGQWADVQAVQVGGNEGKPVGWSDEARAASAKARGVAAPGEAKPPRQAKLPSAAKLAHIGGDDTFKKFEQGLSRRTPEQLAQLKAQAEAGIKTARDMQMRGEKGMSKVAARENSTKAGRSTYHRASNLQKDGVWKEAAYKRALAAIENAKGKPPKAAKTPTAKSLTSSAKAAGVRDPNAAFADVFGKTAKSAGKKGLAMLGPVAVVGAGALAFDSTRNQAMAAGKTSGQANLNAAGAAAIASGSVAAIGYGISKAVSLAVRAAPVAGKVLSRALPVAAVGFAAYEVGRGAVRGYKEGGVGGAFKGAGEGALDFATMGAYSHFTGKAGEGQQGRLSESQKKQFAQADSNYRAMQDAKAAQSNGGGWSDQARIAAYISRVSHAGGTPENLPYGGVPRAEATTEKPSKRR